MSLPPFAEIPPAKIRLSIAPEEWEACLESWISLSELYLRLPEKEFAVLSSDGSSPVTFVRSFYNQKFFFENEDTTLSSPTAHQLERICFRLVHRMLLGRKPPQHLLEFEFLASFCNTHARSSALSRLLSEVSRRPDQVLQHATEKNKRSMLAAMEPTSDVEPSITLLQLADVMRASPDVAAILMVGSDFLDSLSALYLREYDMLHERRLVTAVVYLGLIALSQVDPPQISLLSDHLYGLKAAADGVDADPKLVGAQKSQTLTRELVTNTNLIAKLRRTVSGKGSERLLKLLDTLDTYRAPILTWPKRLGHQKKPPKGKGKAIDTGGEMHMHRMSLVSQVQDLFPDLGSGFVLTLLDEYTDDVEQATAHLLDDSLPPHLRDLDRSEQAPAFTGPANGDVEDLAPRSTPPPQDTYISNRRNVFDDDDLDRLEYDTSRLHIGKKADVTTKDPANKAAILAALAAFDSDDDERDDTYDVDDVGGTVDAAHPDGEPGPADREAGSENDMVLFGLYTSSPDIFARTPEARKNKGRHDLKAETGMTDETIEGWAIMIQRDPKRMRRLEAQFSAFDGRQTALAKTSYREGVEESGTESDGPAGRGGLRARGRGRGRGRGGGGRGNVAGPSSDPNTAQAQRRKEANKGSRANHNRREGRARKMARGGFAG